MNSFISWVGGKKALRDLIVQHFPFWYDRYIEVFGGGGWVLFHKQPRNDFEVYNDFNGLLVNLFRCVQCGPKARRMKKLLRYSLNSRQEFDRIRKVMNDPNIQMADYRRAAYYYQLIRYSYSSGLDSFASQPHDIRSDFPIIDMATRRLANVVIENGSFENVIRHYDRPASFFYCDPPYHNSEQFYKNIGASDRNSTFFFGIPCLASTGGFCSRTTMMTLCVSCTTARASIFWRPDVSTICASGSRAARSSRSC